VIGNIYKTPVHYDTTITDVLTPEFLVEFMHEAKIPKFVSQQYHALVRYSFVWL